MRLGVIGWYFHCQRGSALMLVMWALVFLSMAVFGVVRFVGYGFDDAIVLQKEFRARLLAQSGLAIGLHPLVEQGDPVLRQEMENGEEISVRIRPEDGRIPINIVLEYGFVDSLRTLFEMWELEPEEAAALADSLADWVDRDSQSRMNGAERDYYETLGLPELPRNQPFDSVEEMQFVRGMDRLAEKKPDWQDYFTVHSSGKLNVNGASAEAIALYTLVPLEQAEALVEQRRGEDGEEDTEDDVRFRSVEQFRIALGVPSGEFARVAPLLTVENTLLRVESEGRAGDRRVKLAVIANTTPGKAPEILAAFEN